MIEINYYLYGNLKQIDMKTLKQIKDEYAVKQGYRHWLNLLVVCSAEGIDNHLNELIKVVQKECLKNASQKANLNVYNCDSFGYRYFKYNTDGVSLENGYLYEVNKESINNENNIIK